MCQEPLDSPWSVGQESGYVFSHLTCNDVFFLWGCLDVVHLLLERKHGRARLKTRICKRIHDKGRKQLYKMLSLFSLYILSHHDKCLQSQMRKENSYHCQLLSV